MNNEHYPKKLVILKLDGDFQSHGFRVTLAIGWDGAPPDIELKGVLDAAPEFADRIQSHWHHKYRCISAPYRIKPKKIIYDGSVSQRLRDCQDSATELGDRLRTWLDGEGFRPLDRRLRESLSRQDTIRFLVSTTDPHLQKLPWHLWDFFDHYPKAELALTDPQFERPSQFTSNQRTPKVKILAILGHSQGIDIESDRQLLESLPHTDIKFLVEKSRREINDQLWEKQWDIIFFAGHSETEGETGRIYINQTDSLTIDELWYALRKAVERGLKLAIFNSCDGLGLARQLDDIQIPQMIVMRELVPDRVAQEFLKYFLTAFAQGQPFYLAVRDARERLQGLESQFPCASWLPVIVQNPTQVPPSWNDWISDTTAKPVKRRRRGWQLVLGASVMVTSLVMGVRSLGWLQLTEQQAFDQLLEMRPTPSLDPRLLMVEVTAGDIKQLGGEYPLHDRTLLKLLQKLETYQPRAIGLDIFRDRPEGEGRDELVQYLQTSDRVIPICVIPSPHIPEGVASPPGLPKERLGFADIVVDPDGIVRRHLIAMKPPAVSSCSTFYSLSFQLALHYLQAEGISPEFISEDRWQLGSVTLTNLNANPGFYQRGVGLEGFQVLLNYRSPEFAKTMVERVTLSDIWANRVNSDFLQDKIILIGITDPTIKDEFQTPGNHEMRGLFLHSQMVSQIISAAVGERPLLAFFPLWGDLVCVGIGSVIGGAIAWHYRESLLRLGLAVGVSMITINGIGWFIFIQTGSILPMVPVMLAVVATSVSLGAYQAFRTSRSDETP
ncbi:MAG: CHASE2 domain-containing protein [Coleofasciculus sp. A1-SPW-01]|uniref:CHASE2 domain-containing protein n=1 Tax=Coleofasciculus sp. A1-SPW-01 TaxID=3070819 RepID=UPI0032F246AA